jgi:hypothetical protein
MAIILSEQHIIESVSNWVETFVVGMNLCPFAKRELIKNRIHFQLSDAHTEAELLEELQVELERLSSDDKIETTLLIHPQVLQDFFDYNQFLDYADALLVQQKLDGIYQIASFHPHYQFGGTQACDAENFTNRSPYPILHILREESLANAIDQYPDSDSIPVKNIELMNTLGTEKLSQLLQQCSNPNPPKYH